MSWFVLYLLRDLWHIDKDTPEEHTRSRQTKTELPPEQETLQIIDDLFTPFSFSDSMNFYLLVQVKKSVRGLSSR